MGSTIKIPLSPEIMRLMIAKHRDFFQPVKAVDMCAKEKVDGKCPPGGNLLIRFADPETEVEAGLDENGALKLTYKFVVDNDRDPTNGRIYKYDEYTFHRNTPGFGYKYEYAYNGRGLNKKQWEGWVKQIKKNVKLTLGPALNKFAEGVAKTFTRYFEKKYINILAQNKAFLKLPSLRQAYKNFIEKKSAANPLTPPPQNKIVRLHLADFQSYYTIIKHPFTTEVIFHYAMVDRDPNTQGVVLMRDRFFLAGNLQELIGYQRDYVEPLGNPKEEGWKGFIDELKKNPPPSMEEASQFINQFVPNIFKAPDFEELALRIEAAEEGSREITEEEFHQINEELVQVDKAKGPLKYDEALLEKFQKGDKYFKPLQTVLGNGIAFDLRDPPLTFFVEVMGEETRVHFRYTFQEKGAIQPKEKLQYIETFVFHGEDLKKIDRQAISHRIKSGSVLDQACQRLLQSIKGAGLPTPQNEVSQNFIKSLLPFLAGHLSYTDYKLIKDQIDPEKFKQLPLPKQLSILLQIDSVEEIHQSLVPVLYRAKMGVQERALFLRMLEASRHGDQAGMRAASQKLGEKLQKIWMPIEKMKKEKKVVDIKIQQGFDNLIGLKSVLDNILAENWEDAHRALINIPADELRQALLPTVQKMLKKKQVQEAVQILASVGAEQIVRRAKEGTRWYGGQKINKAEELKALQGLLAKSALQALRGSAQNVLGVFHELNRLSHAGNSPSPVKGEGVDIEKKLALTPEEKKVYQRLIQDPIIQQISEIAEGLSRPIQASRYFHLANNVLYKNDFIQSAKLLAEMVMTKKLPAGRALESIKIFSRITMGLFKHPSFSKVLLGMVQKKIKTLVEELKKDEVKEKKIHQSLTKILKIDHDFQLALQIQKEFESLLTKGDKLSKLRINLSTVEVLQALEGLNSVEEKLRAVILGNKFLSSNEFKNLSPSLGLFVIKNKFGEKIDKNLAAIKKHRWNELLFKTANNELFIEIQSAYQNILTKMEKEALHHPDLNAILLLKSLKVSKLNETEKILRNEFLKDKTLIRFCEVASDPSLLGRMEKYKKLLEEELLVQAGLRQTHQALEQLNLQRKLVDLRVTEYHPGEEDSERQNRVGAQLKFTETELEALKKKKPKSKKIKKLEEKIKELRKQGIEITQGPALSYLHFQNSIKNLLDRIDGHANVFVNMDYGSTKVYQELTKPTSLVAMAIAPGVGVGAEWLGLKILGSWATRAGVLGFSARVGASAVGVAAEGWAFTTAQKVGDSAFYFSEGQWDRYWQDVKSSVALFAGMRAGHSAVAHFSQNVLAKGRMGKFFGGYVRPNPGEVLAQTPVGRAIPQTMAGMAVPQLKVAGRRLTTFLSHTAGISAMFGAGYLNRSIGWHLEDPTQKKDWKGHFVDAMVSYGQAMISFNVANAVTLGRLQGSLGHYKLKLHSMRTPQPSAPVIPEGTLVVDLADPRDIPADHLVLQSLAQVPRDQQLSLARKIARAKDLPTLLRKLQGDYSGGAQILLHDLRETLVKHLSLEGRPKQLGYGPKVGELMIAERKKLVRSDNPLLQQRHQAELARLVEKQYNPKRHDVLFKREIYPIEIGELEAAYYQAKSLQQLEGHVAMVRNFNQLWEVLTKSPVDTLDGFRFVEITERIQLEQLKGLFVHTEHQCSKLEKEIETLKQKGKSEEAIEKLTEKETELKELEKLKIEMAETIQLREQDPNEQGSKDPTAIIETLPTTFGIRQKARDLLEQRSNQTSTRDNKEAQSALIGLVKDNIQLNLPDDFNFAQNALRHALDNFTPAASRMLQKLSPGKKVLNENAQPTFQAGELDMVLDVYFGDKKIREIPVDKAIAMARILSEQNLNEQFSVLYDLPKNPGYARILRGRDVANEEYVLVRLRAKDGEALGPLPTTLEIQRAEIDAKKYVETHSDQKAANPLYDPTTKTYRTWVMHQEGMSELRLKISEGEVVERSLHYYSYYSAKDVKPWLAGAFQKLKTKFGKDFKISKIKWGEVKDAFKLPVPLQESVDRLKNRYAEKIEIHRSDPKKFQESIPYYEPPWLTQISEKAAMKIPEYLQRYEDWVKSRKSSGKNPPSPPLPKGGNKKPSPPEGEGAPQSSLPPNSKAFFQHSDPRIGQVNAKIKEVKEIRDASGVKIGEAQIIAGGEEGEVKIQLDDGSVISGKTSTAGRKAQQDSILIAVFQLPDGRQVKLLAGSDGAGGHSIFDPDHPNQYLGGEFASAAFLQGVHAGAVEAIQQGRVPLAGELFSAGHDAFIKQLELKKISLPKGASIPLTGSASIVVMVGDEATIATATDSMVTLNRKNTAGKNETIGYSNADNIYISPDNPYNGQIHNGIHLNNPNLYYMKLQKGDVFALASDGGWEALIGESYKENGSERAREHANLPHPKQEIFNNLGKYLDAVEKYPMIDPASGFHDLAFENMKNPGQMISYLGETFPMPDVSHPDNIFTIVYRQGEKLQCNQPVEVPPSYKPLEAIGTPIKLKADTLSEWVNQYGNDIGLNGILLRDPSPLPVGSTVLFELILKDSPYPFKTRGKVVWSEGEKMVVEFDPLNSDAQELLARILYEAGEKRGTDNNPTDPIIPLLEEEGLTDPALNTLATQAGMEVTIERATEDKPHKVVVQYDASNIEEFFEKYPLVIGREGIMVKTPEPLMPIPHDSVEFELRLKDGTLLLSGVGEVDWARKEDPEHPGVPPGMGIKFSNRSPETEMNFGKVLAQQENKDGYLRPGIPSSGELSIAQKPTLQKLRRELIQEIYYLFEDAIRKSSSQELLDITFWIDPKTGKLIKDPAQQSGAIMVNPLWLPGRGIALKSVENAHLWHLLGKVKDKDLVQETILRTIRELPLLPFKFPTNPGGEGTTSPIGPANDNALFSGSSENPKVSSPVEIILNRDPNNTPSYLIARFDVESPEDFMQGYGQYLTRGGLFLPTTQSISNGAEFPFEVQMGSTNLYGTGKVIYVQHTGPQHPEKLAGIGIQFIDLVLESRVLLEGLMLEKDSKKN